jgi:hypothetical protein
MQDQLKKIAITDPAAYKYITGHKGTGFTEEPTIDPIKQEVYHMSTRAEKKSTELQDLSIDDSKAKTPGRKLSDDELMQVSGGGDGYFEDNGPKVVRKLIGTDENGDPIYVEIIEI